MKADGGCRGCLVGPEDECLDDCQASALLRAGWSLDEVERLLDGPDTSALRPSPTGEASLTPEEHELMDVLSDVASRFRKLIRPDRSGTASDDFAEVASRVHDLQARVLAAAAARLYPDHYRSVVSD